MVIIKWRIDPNGDFKFYTEITNDLFYHCSPTFYQGEFNRENKTYDFELLNINGIRENDTTIYRPIESFRIITNNNNLDYIITKDSKYNTIIKDSEILRWFENDIEIPFDRKMITDKNISCVLDYVNNLFVVMKGKFEITNDISNLRKIDYNDFVNRFKIK